MRASSTKNLNFDTEFIILENIYGLNGQHVPLRQRDLAQIAGASLGMTNSILKRLAKKGWITVKKMNSRNIQYALTIEGINEVFHRSYRYFKRTIKNAVFFKDALENLVYQARENNINNVILAGTSDLDFIVEHVSRRCGLNFLRTSECKIPLDAVPEDSLFIYSEDFAEVRDNKTIKTLGNTFFLSSLIIKQAAGLEKNVEQN
jgi:DNA-binding MarR family transcriptional regulator